MEELRVQRAFVNHQPSWLRWPDTEDRDYSVITAQRWVERFIDDSGERAITVVSRSWPVFSSFLRVKDGFEKPHRYPPHLDNSVWPSEEVQVALRSDLRALAQDGVRIIHWEHGYGCYPPNAEVLKKDFPLAILQFGDDVYGSSEFKTFPVAKYFHAYLHAMFLMNAETGERVSERYQKLGVDRTYFGSSRTTVGTTEWCAQHYADNDMMTRRLHAIREDKFSTDLVWVGAQSGSNLRRRMLAALNSGIGELRGVRCRLHGDAMRDGFLVPRNPLGGDGMLVAPIYDQALFGVNLPWSSIFNTRLFDLWYMGVCQIIHDPWNELKEEGFEAGVHYIPFDGTIRGLLDTVLRYKADTEAVVRIVTRAKERVETYIREKNRVLPQIYFDHWDALKAWGSK